jgi:cobalt-zinc-cadmium efflux system outer membrane protein
MNPRFLLMVPMACLAVGTAGPVWADDFRMEVIDEKTIARESSGARVSLSLDEALDRALQSNNSLRAARAGIQGFQGRLRHAGRWLPANPEVELETAEREKDGETSDDKGIRLSQEIWIAGQRGLGKDAAEASLSAAEKRLAYLETSTRARVRRAYLNTLVAREAVDTARRAAELTDQLHRFARKQLQAGASSKLVLNTARIGAARAEAELEAAKRDFARARLALVELLAMDADGQTLELTSELDLGHFRLPEMGALLPRALKQRQDLAAAAREVVAARKELALSKRQLIPNLTVFGFSKEEEGADVTGFGVELPVPLWHWRGGENDQARSELRQAQIAQDALRLQVRTEVANALNDYEAARKRLAVFGEGVLASAEENVRLTEEAFRAGSVGAPALATAQDDLINTRRDYLGTLREAIAAATALERATGGLVALRAGKAAGTNNAGDSDNE